MPFAKRRRGNNLKSADPERPADPNAFQKALSASIDLK